MKTKQTDEPSLTTRLTGTYPKPPKRKPAPAQAQHSPLPWHINAGTINGRADYQIYSDEANRTPIAQLIQNERHDVADVAANARLIVRACNNAQRLADALDRIIRDDTSDEPSIIEGLEALAEWEKAQ